MKPLYSKDQIIERNAQLAGEIVRDYPPDTRLLVVGVLKGAYHFMSDLTRAIEESPLNIERRVMVEDDFTTVSSYKDGHKGVEPKLVMDVNSIIGGRDVLIVDDILDTGNTLKFLYNHFRNLKANSIHTAVMVRRVLAQVEGTPDARYVGFDYDGKKFLVGYGLDDKGVRRNLPYIGTIDPE
jgi:hypoxanthine phosphoribosyltransferase